MDKYNINLNELFNLTDKNSKLKGENIRRNFKN